MIKIFRTIRQRTATSRGIFDMLPENRFSRYFLYAIGEIVLVVIGILIALQINDWNDQRKNRAYEQEILLLIDQNLQNDAELLRIEMESTTLALQLTDRLLEEVAHERYSDSLNFWMGRIISFERFRSQSSSFEVLKAKGIGMVRDKELQLALIAYYDERLFKLYESLNDVMASFNADWVPIIKTDFVDFKFKEYCVPIDQRAFLAKPTSIVLFKLFKDNRGGQLRKMESALTDIDHIRKLIAKNHP